MQTSLHVRCGPIKPTIAIKQAAKQPSVAQYIKRSSQLTLQATNEGDKITDNQPVVPDTPPAKDTPQAAAQATESDDSASSSGDESTMSVEEIQRRAAQYRAERAPQPSQNFVEGVLEEVQLIQWPSPAGALFNTVLVVGIVAGTSALLFGVNTFLTEASKLLYSAH